MPTITSTSTSATSLSSRARSARTEWKCRRKIAPVSPSKTGGGGSGGRPCKRAQPSPNEGLPFALITSAVVLLAQGLPHASTELERRDRKQPAPPTDLAGNACHGDGVGVQRLARRGGDQPRDLLETSEGVHRCAAAGARENVVADPD